MDWAVGRAGTKRAAENNRRSFDDLEGEAGFGEPGELDGGVGHSVERGGVGGDAGVVDGGGPVLEVELAVEFELGAEALDDLEAEIVEGGAAGDEVLGDFLIAIVDLKVFVATEVEG